MRNLLAFLATAALVFLGLGWYLDWYSFKSVPAGSPGHQSFSIDINKDKISRDVQKGVEKGEEKVHEALDKKKVDATPKKTAATPAYTDPFSRATALVKEAEDKVNEAMSRTDNAAEHAPRSTGLITGGPGGSKPVQE